MLRARKITKWFGTKRVLHDVSFDIDRGERIVLLGENGSGKSTLLQIVSGVIDSDRGDLSLPQTTGYAAEKPDIPDHLLSREWLDLIGSLKRADWHEELGIRSLLGKKVAALSLGQRQRISLVASWIGDPDLLVLDEPTNALDRDAREEIIARVCASTALVATHDRDFAERVGTRTLTLRDGVLVAA